MAVTNEVKVKVTVEGERELGKIEKLLKNIQDESSELSEESFGFGNGLIESAKGIKKVFEGIEEEIDNLKNTLSDTSLSKKEAAEIENKIKKYKETAKALKAMSGEAKDTSSNKSKKSSDNIFESMAEKGFDIKSFVPSKIMNKTFEGVNKGLGGLRNKLKDFKNTEDYQQMLGRIDELRQAKKQGTITDQQRGELKYLSKKDTIQNSKIAAVNAMQYAINSVKNLGTLALSVFDSMGISLTSIMSSVSKNIKDAFDKDGIASYSTGTSLFSNASARNTQMTYGISGGKAYALTQTMSMLNMKSEEDLMYMNSAQKEKFTQLMDKYNSWYDEMESSGFLEDVQEAQLEFEMFKQELSMKFLSWFAENKDTIMSVLNFVFNALKVIVDILSGILSIFGQSVSTSSLSSSSSSDNVNTSAQASNVNVNVNSTNNATALLNNQQELQQTLDNSNTNLVKNISAKISAIY